MRYKKFIFVSYLTAAFFELIANTVGDGKLFANPGWPIFFLLWYGLLYSVLFLFAKNKKLWVSVVFFAILGTIVEILVFKRSNLLIDPIIYALMALIPLWIMRVRNIPK